MEETIFDFFDKIRNEELSNTDMYILLKKKSNNFDKDILNIISRDLELYLFIEKEEKEAEYSIEDKMNIVNDYQKKGLKIPYIKRTPFNELTNKQKEYRLKTGDIEREPIIDYEKLLFPFEFFNLYVLRNLINKVINPDKVFSGKLLKYDREDQPTTQEGSKGYEKIKVKGSLQSIGYIFSELIDKGWIIPPKRNGKINKTAVARLILEHFELIDRKKPITTEEYTRRTISAKKTDSGFNKDKMDRFRIPSEKSINSK
ncbi:hypothetical protein NHN08_09105 [Riemerella anatipestifer]|uniref:hypothetical protein n=1 Tax=Riemerella anatipestifer TaxID=34085 RepID=UPI002097AF33|nr:hypothetical protein [Riemerella anatipestifer]MCO7332657.1 hypothetical protein [Riemerella anatipestifer]MCO7351547.1 hypothetical protein [Riemerella anatipestifer]